MIIGLLLFIYCLFVISVLLSLLISSTKVYNSLECTKMRLKVKHVIALVSSLFLLYSYCSILLFSTSLNELIRLTKEGTLTIPILLLSFTLYIILRGAKMKIKEVKNVKNI